MEHSSLIAAFSILSLRERFRQASPAQRTLIAASSIPTVSTSSNGLNHVVSSNFTTATTSKPLVIPYLSKLTGAIILPSPSLPTLKPSQTEVAIIIITILIVFISFSFINRKQSQPPSPAYQWPEYPFPLIHNTTSKITHRRSHYSHHAARLMAATHNTIFRGLNAVYAQSFYVRPGTASATDLLEYCTIVLDFLHHHHSTEERIFFPLISAATSDPSFTAENVAQHRAFESSLHTLQLYALTTPSSCFSAHRLRSLIEDFAPVLSRHLHDEIPSILSLHNRIPSGTLREIYGKLLAAAERESNPFIAAPFVFGCQDRHFLLDGQPFSFPEHPLPIPVIRVVVHWLMSWRYCGAWRFSPSSVYGEPRRTAFCGRS